MKELERAVLATLVWFDLSRQPLTTFECWHYLLVEGGKINVSPSDVLAVLEKLKIQGLVLQEIGFWQLISAIPLVKERQERARLVIEKRKMAERGARLMAMVPFVRFVGLVNTASYEHASEDSDIDIFIISAPGRLWLTRIFATILIHLVGLRRHGKKIKDRLCLSFFVTELATDLSALRLTDDPYLVYWVAGVFPLWGEVGYEAFLRVNNWVKNVLPNRFLDTVPYATTKESEMLIKKFFEIVLSGFLGVWLNKLSKVLQLARHRHHRSSRLWQGGTAVVVTDDIMKFHETDQREHLAVLFRQRLSSYNLS